LKKKQTLKKTKNNKIIKGKNVDSVKKYELLGIAFVVVGVISLLGLGGLNVGFVGLYFAKALSYMFGIGAYIVPLIIICIGMQYIIKHKGVVYSARFFGLALLFVSLLAIYHHFMVLPGKEILPESLPDAGGLIGGTVLFTLRRFFGVDGTIVILFAGVLGAILISTTWSLAIGMLKTKKHAENGMSTAKETIINTYDKIVEAETKVKYSFYNQEKDKNFAEEVLVEEKPIPLEPMIKQNLDDSEEKAEPFCMAATAREKIFPIQYVNQAEDISEKEEINIIADASPKTEIPATVTAEKEKVYEIPKVSYILSKKVKKKNTRLEREIAENARILEKTLADFHVKAKIINACHGPAVTRYELEPAPGVKVSKIVNLADDICLSLAAFSVRIEPVPGKAAIGIEVPNRDLEGVQLREVLENDAFATAKSKLTVGLGMDIGGQAIFADLAKMPHLLVAGATGSGKSVCINTIITSILFKANADEVKFILIDPKMVELSNYNGIPHLMVPVVTDAKKAASVLNWAVQEMEKRYAKFAEHGVRDMERYNKSSNDNKMPAIVIIIDELADLMMVAPHDVEDAICRLAQKARAAGLHLVLATQRPSVDVITGIIKANIPSRISFSVSSQIDSRTILDMSGAEKLLGKGDMLFYPVGAAKPRRVQGAFISDHEVEDLLDFIRKQGAEAEMNEEIISFTENALKEETKTENPEQQQDELLERAINIVLSTRQASSSGLQRRFRIGYTRAARLIDTMEELHIIGPSIGSKPREILMTSEEAATVIKK
jgi:DNA segregation ATPase FtsK/SpoIIIE, S-DNA-T family